MPLAPGVRLGAYEIISLIGTGGMGEVYRAHDARLGRDVAIKILPAVFSADRERLSRFEQEARATAALNHPNILAVFDTGIDAGAPYVVSELLEGETLRGRLSTGPLPVRKAVDCGIQIACGLAAAHEKGIVHRDLKPENIFVTDDGHVKILDFGLAKLTQREGSFVATSNAPTTPVQTQHGMVLGTLGYMAPEQVRGLAADHRDIFAFGAVLYEMLSGQRAFRGDTTADTMTAILKEHPPDLPLAERHIPPALARIVDRCLEKTPAARFGTAGDLAFALEALSSYSERVEQIAPAALPSVRSRISLPWVLVACLSAALAGSMVLGMGGYLQRATAPRIYRATLLPPPNTMLSDTSPARRLALSPDGGRLAFTAAGPDGRAMLWVRPLDGLGTQPLAGTEDAVAPFWSPDGKFIGFYAGVANGKLKKIDAAGDPPLTLCNFTGSPAGASWNRDDTILFTSTGAGGGPIRRVPAAGGEPSVLLTPDPKQQELEYPWPFFLPDGRHFLYLALGIARVPLGIYVAALDSTDRKLLMRGGSNSKYANGHLLFLREQTLMAQPFDPSRLELTGEPVPVAEQLQLLPPTGAFTVSESGVLAYQAGVSVAGTQLVWFDRSGKQTSTMGDMATYGDLELSPDGSHLAVTIADPTNGTNDVWVYDVARGLRSRFTFDPVNKFTPIWSPDGSRIVFSRFPGAMLQKLASGAGPEDPLPGANPRCFPRAGHQTDDFSCTDQEGLPGQTAVIYGSYRNSAIKSRSPTSRRDSMNSPRSFHPTAGGWLTCPTSLAARRSMWRRFRHPAENGRFRRQAERFLVGALMGRKFFTSRQITS